MAMATFKHSTLTSPMHEAWHKIASDSLLRAGCKETFDSVEQLVQCVRPGVMLDAASVPSLRSTDRHGRPLPLNRYILDFWGHGQKTALVSANGLREGDPSFADCVDCEL